MADFEIIGQLHTLYDGSKEGTIVVYRKFFCPFNCESNLESRRLPNSSVNPNPINLHLDDEVWSFSYQE
jgi:hypothetical protein